MGVRYRFVLQLDVTDENDPDFERLSDVNSTIIETRVVDPDLHGGDIGRLFSAAEAMLNSALVTRGLEARY